MSAESIESMQQRLAAYDRSASDQADAAAIQSAIAAAGVPVKPGLEPQVAQLLRADLRRGVLDGQSIVCGPGGVPLAAHVAARLGSAEFAHFRAEPGGMTPTTLPGQPGLTAVLRAQMPGMFPGVGPVAPGESLGARIIANATQAAGSPTMDMGRSMLKGAK